MEQSRAHGKSQWYHETQSRNQTADVLPLVPEAAHVADRFLLDLTLPDDVSEKSASWLQISSVIANHLFPNSVNVTRLHTFSVYERLSTALTVAQVSGVQRLCNHYAARLAPLPGPDSSRESNHRLAQITQFARQLAGSPSVICQHSRQQLDAVGLSTPDIVLISQIVGFVGYQARVIAACQALLGQPARWIPGMPVQEDAPASLFDSGQTQWQSRLPHNGGQEYPDTFAELTPLLAWDAALLEAEETLLHALIPNAGYAPFVALVTARINGSLGCFGQYADQTALTKAARDGEAALQQWCRDKPGHQAILQAVLLLNRAPDRFSSALFTPLTEQGFSREQALGLLAWSGFHGWFNRLKIGLGEALPVT
ncbi:CMD domain-containing protein [Enterobacteriaceae bacterium RIT691]|nr:CMD domain-containing protein [Enterobacteriaceae bacterium RIT691]